MHLDNLIGRHDLDALPRRAGMPRQLGPQHLFPPDQRQAQFGVFSEAGQRGGDDFGRAVIPAHGVQCDCCVQDGLAGRG